VDATIRLITANDSISELTALIRRAYKVLADMGFNYTGAYQDEAMTRARIADGECFVMVDGGKTIGTIVLYPPNNSFPWLDRNSWYAKPNVALCGQFAVEPELQRKGCGARLMDFVEMRAAAQGANELALDTAEGATHLIRYYKNRGYRFMGYIQHEGKTYRSAILSKVVGGSL
jgi:GNAT superfamily N-acetyltransferase